MWKYSVVSLILAFLVHLGESQLGSLSEMLSDPTMSKLLMGGGSGGLGAAGGLGGGLGGLGGGLGLGGEAQLNIGSLMENPMQMLTDPTIRQLLTSGGGAATRGVDPAMLSALIDIQSAPLLDTNTIAQLSQLNDLIPSAPTTPKPAATAAPAKAASTINLSIGDSSATLGKDQSLADLIKRLQLRRKKKEVATAASAAIETVPNGNLGPVFSETLKPSNLNPSLPVAKMLELAKDGIGVQPALQNMVCPTKQCPFPLACGNPVKTYTPETFFVCPECPMCPGDILKGVSARLGKVVRIAQPKTKTRKIKKSNSGARTLSFDASNFAGW